MFTHGKLRKSKIFFCVFFTEIFSDCKDIKLFGNDSDGLYTIYPDPLTETPVVVYCDMTTDGGGVDGKRVNNQ